MQSLHGFLDRCFIVKSVQLEDIDVFELQSLERVFDRREDPLKRKDEVSDA